MNVFVERDRIRQLLADWSAGTIDESAVHMATEYIFEQLQDRMESPSRSEAISVVYELLSHLSILYYQLVTPEDIPAMLRFLDTPSGHEEQAWQEWEHYWNQLDMERRRQTLLHHAYYMTTPLPHERKDEHN